MYFRTPAAAMTAAADDHRVAQDARPGAGRAARSGIAVERGQTVAAEGLHGGRVAGLVGWGERSAGGGVQIWTGG
jgi:hypothetical protein